MAGDNAGRRLAAILAADVVGFSRLMERDETGTLAALKRHREKVFDPTLAAFNGRVVKLIGDGTLAEFGSVVDAVNCAIAVQRLAATDSGGPSPAITLRIGINLGDVIIEGADIYGDGVNVAARLEPLAEPGGVCIAGIVQEAVGNRVEVAFHDSGDMHVKNIERPVRIWKWHPSAAPAKPGSGAVHPPLPKPPAEKPSIAVLPFQNMSGDAEQEYFSDGITEDILTDLSKVVGLLVIARNSSFAYKGKPTDIRTVGRELGVGAVLEGSIRRAGNRVRITAQLIDAKTGGHLWAERYDRDLSDIFAVQDEVTHSIVEALKIVLTPREVELIAAEGGINLKAHDEFMLGRDVLYGPIKNREVFERSVYYFEQAIANDPTYGAPHGGMVMAHLLNFQNHWTEDSADSPRKAAPHVAAALAKGPDDAFVHYSVAAFGIMTGDLARAEVEAEKALAINPNSALAGQARGIVHIYAGEPMSAVPHLEKAIRLDPLFGQQYIHFLGCAYFLAGKYETAVAHFRERIRLVPNTDFSRVFLASALGHLGETEEARRIWAEIPGVNPKYSFAEHIGRLPFRNQADRDRIAEGLRKAGIEPN